MNSILPEHLYTKIRTSYEGIVSAAIADILKRSGKARDLLNLIVWHATGTENPSLSYRLETTGSLPVACNIAGTDQRGKNLLMVEVMLQEKNSEDRLLSCIGRMVCSGTLILIVPEKIGPSVHKRVSGLIHKPSGQGIPDTGVSNIIRLHNNISVVIKSCEAIFRAIGNVLITEGRHELITVVDELARLCDTRQSFMPIHNRQLSPVIPRQMRAYTRIVDQTVDELARQNKRPVSTSRLKRTPLRDGYCRYFNYGDFGLGFSVRYDLWEQYCATPFWLTVAMHDDSGNWIHPDFFSRECCEVANGLPNLFKQESNNCFFSVIPLLNAEGDRVIRNFAFQIHTIVTALEEKACESQPM